MIGMPPPSVDVLLWTLAAVFAVVVAYYRHDGREHQYNDGNHEAEHYDPGVAPCTQRPRTHLMPARALSDGAP